jgi:hypothetical protein
MKESLRTVDQLAEQSKGVCLKLLMGDMNFDPQEGIYQEVSIEESSHVLIQRNGSDEKKLIEKGVAIPSGWNLNRYLQAKIRAGFLLSSRSWKPSKAFPREKIRGSKYDRHWISVLPKTSVEASVTTSLTLDGPGRGEEKCSYIFIISRNKSADSCKRHGKYVFDLYKQADLEKVTLIGQRMIDWCFGAVSSKASEIEIESKVVQIGSLSGSWLDSVSDHKPILCTVRGLH